MASTAKIARDPGTGVSKGYGFVSYTDFEASDAAIESMNGQFLMNKAITVQYAFKKDGKGERHGTQAERMLAAQARKNNALPPSGRPPASTMVYGPQPPMPTGFQAPYQPGQFAGALAQPPPPPVGFTPQQTVINAAPPQGMPVFQGFPPPPPPPAGFAPYPGAMPPPPQPQF